jgi:hypothetical protein
MLQLGNLFMGIKTRYDDTAELTSSASGGLWHQMAPEGVPYPFIVFQLLSGTIDPILDNLEKPIEQLVVRFSIVSDNADTDDIDVILENIDEAYGTHADKLTIANYKHITSIRSNLTTDSDLNTQIWQYDVDYDVWMQRI